MTSDTPIIRYFPDINYEGMTLRDYFAAKALAGLSTNFSTTPEQDASNAYKIADAMLAEYLKRQPAPVPPAPDPVITPEERARGLMTLEEFKQSLDMISEVGTPPAHTP